MNKPRVRTGIATATPFQSEQTLTRPFQLVPGAVLIATHSPPQERSCGARLRECRGFSVKNVRISLFTSVFTPDFTFSILNLPKGRNMQNRNFKSDGRKTTKTGGSARWFRQAKPYDRHPSPAELRLASSVGAWDMNHADLHKPCNTASTPGPQEGEN